MHYTFGPAYFSIFHREVSNYCPQYISQLRIFTCVSGQEIEVLSEQVSAAPDSVNVLYQDETMQGGDVRTPDKLVNHVTSDDSARNSWLAPILPNTVGIHFCILKTEFLSFWRP